MSDAHGGGTSAHDTDPADLIAAVDVERARAAVADAIRRTPTVHSTELSEEAGSAVALKAESLQGTGSFKLRGAINKVAALGDRARAGLVTGSAGNHGRAVAAAARLRGLDCEVFMPREAAVSKVAAVERLGARVTLAGSSVEDAVEHGLAKAGADGPAFVHPFDDLDVIAGQGTLALELLEDLPDLARVIVPVGGGGLVSGIGIALRQARPEVQIVGVQARSCAPYAHALAQSNGEGTEQLSSATIADGIALKRPGTLTLPLVRELVRHIETVTEDEIAEAMVFLATDAKLVAEGAGAVAVAALRSGRLAPIEGTTAAIVSGGNVDSGLLASLLRRHETHEGRRVRMFTRVADRPGGLAELLNLVAGAHANLVSLEHVRDAVTLGVRETGVELTLETRGPHHTEDLRAALEGAGYTVEIE